MYVLITRQWYYSERSDGSGSEGGGGENEKEGRRRRDREGWEKGGGRGGKTEGEDLVCSEETRRKGKERKGWWF